MSEPKTGALVQASAPTVNDALYVMVRRLLAPLRRAPWWLKVTLLYSAARLVSYAILLGAAWHADESPWGGRQPDYLTFIDRWDAGWYERIYDGGYPTTIPRNADGTAQPNQWAFYPVFPLLARGLSAVMGWSWPAAGAIDAIVTDGTIGLYLGWVCVATAACQAAAAASSALILAESRLLWRAALFL